MIRNLAAGLFEHGQVETTLPKARAAQPFVERIITIAKKGDFTARRRIEAMINDRKIHAWVADPNVTDARKDNPYFDLPDADEIEFNRYGDVRKAPRLVQHIMTRIGPMFADRDGGYTRIVKLGKHRLGDGTDLVLFQLVGREKGPQLSGGGSTRRQQADRRAAFAAQLRKAAAADSPAAVSASSEDEAEAAAPGEEVQATDVEASEESDEKPEE